MCFSMVFARNLYVLEVAGDLKSPNSIGFSRGLGDPSCVKLAALFSMFFARNSHVWEVAGGLQTPNSIGLGGVGRGWAGEFFR